MVVDDEPDLEVLIRQSFRKKIRQDSLSFVFAGNGREALDILQAEEVDLVLTDINMPQMDGLTLLSHLDRQDKILKTIVVSAYGDMKNIRTAMNRGAFDFLVKPIDLEDLSITIDRTLDQVNIMREAYETRRDMDAAWQLQRAILPREIPHSEAIRVSAHYLPMKSIGGDFYEFNIISPHEIGFFVADVSGHGVPAALIASMLKVAFGMIKDKGREPSLLLESLNSIMKDKLHNAFFTAVYCYIDLEKKRLRVARAGHPSMLIYKKQEKNLQVIHPKGKLMGWFESLDCVEEEYSISQGDRILLYTDGIIEAENSTKEFYGDKRFDAFIRENAGLDIETFAQALLKEVDEFSDQGLEDDLTLLVLDIIT